MTTKSEPTNEAERLPLVLREKQVLALVGLSATTLLLLRKAGQFPQPVRLSKRTTGWLTCEIESWLAEKAAERAA